MELNCKKALDLLNEYIDGELGANDTEFVRSHIEKCPECKKSYEELKELENILASSAETAPSALYDRVMDEVRAEKSAVKKPFIIRKWSMVAVAAVICLSILSTPTILMLATGGAKEECADNAIADVMEGFDQKAPTASGMLADKAEADDNQYCCTEQVSVDTAPEHAEILVDSGEYTAYLKDGKEITLTIDTENMIAYIGETKYALKINDNYCLTNGLERLCFTLRTGDTIRFIETD